MFKRNYKGKKKMLYDVLAGLYPQCTETAQNIINIIINDFLDKENIQTLYNWFVMQEKIDAEQREQEDYQTEHYMTWRALDGIILEKLKVIR